MAETAADATADRKAERCNYLVAWVGYCQERKPCTKHGGFKCWSCGGPATRDCCHAGQFVCGKPCCELHPHEFAH